LSYFSARALPPLLAMRDRYSLTAFSVLFITYPASYHFVATLVNEKMGRTLVFYGGVPFRH
jgi:hypothetical protein